LYLSYHLYGMKSKLILTKQEYRILYETLWRKIVAQEYSAPERAKLREYSPTVFLRKTKSTEFAFTLIARTGITDPRYLTRQYRLLGKREVAYIEFNELLLYNCLVYMGYVENHTDKLLGTSEKDVEKGILKERALNIVGNLAKTFFKERRIDYNVQYLGNEKKKKAPDDSDRIKEFENRNWYVFFVDELKHVQNNKATKVSGVSWAVLKCKALGKAELIKQKSPNENRTPSVYIGNYFISKDGRDLQFDLSMKGERNLRISCYIGNNSNFDYCMGMATNTTETFEAWAVVFVSSKKIKSLSLKPGFHSKKLPGKKADVLPDYIYKFFEDRNANYLIIPKTGTGVADILDLITGRNKISIF